MVSIVSSLCALPDFFLAPSGDVVLFFLQKWEHSIHKILSFAFSLLFISDILFYYRST